MHIRGSVTIANVVLRRTIQCEHGATSPGHEGSDEPSISSVHHALNQWAAGELNNRVDRTDGWYVELSSCRNAQRSEIKEMTCTMDDVDAMTAKHILESCCVPWTRGESELVEAEEERDRRQLP